MATNQLLPFATAPGANVIPYASWSALTAVLANGFQSGIASSEQFNRLLSQGALASYVLGQLVVDETAQDADLDEATLYANFKAAIRAFIKVPIGSFLCFAGNVVPDGYLLCNGAAVSRTTYADLYAVIGDAYGAGDGSTTFNLPDADGRVLQGVSDLTKVGQLLNSQLPNITGGAAIFTGDTGLGKWVASGAFRVGIDAPINAYAQTTTGSSATTAREIIMDASQANSIYSNSNTSVQNPAIQALIAIRYE